jgi:hypothetical protein
VTKNFFFDSQFAFWQIKLECSSISCVLNLVNLDKEPGAVFLVMCNPSMNEL